VVADFAGMTRFPSTRACSDDAAGVRFLDGEPTAAADQVARPRRPVAAGRPGPGRVRTTGAHGPQAGGPAPDPGRDHLPSADRLPVELPAPGAAGRQHRFTVIMETCASGQQQELVVR